MAEYMNNMPDAALDWDSEVTNEQRDFVLLPAGRLPVYRTEL